MSCSIFTNGVVAQGMLNVNPCDMFSLPHDLAEDDTCSDTHPLANELCNYKFIKKYSTSQHNVYVYIYIFI